MRNKFLTTSLIFLLSLINQGFAQSKKSFDFDNLNNTHNLKSNPIVKNQMKKKIFYKKQITNRKSLISKNNLKKSLLNLVQSKDFKNRSLIQDHKKILPLKARRILRSHKSQNTLPISINSFKPSFEILKHNIEISNEKKLQALHEKWKIEDKERRTKFVNTSRENFQAISDFYDIETKNRNKKYAEEEAKSDEIYKNKLANIQAQGQAEQNKIEAQLQRDQETFKKSKDHLEQAYKLAEESKMQQQKLTFEASQRTREDLKRRAEESTRQANARLNPRDRFIMESNAAGMKIITQKTRAGATPEELKLLEKKLLKDQDEKLRQIKS